MWLRRKLQHLRLIVGTPCHFALFELQPSFRLDLEQLATRYRELARGVHPDRFADASEREQRLALERSASLNEAYQTLKNPPKRARYLLAMNGGELPIEVTVHDPDFLMQQMQWRPIRRATCRCRVPGRLGRSRTILPVVRSGSPPWPPRARFARR